VDAWWSHSLLRGHAIGPISMQTSAKRSKKTWTDGFWCAEQAEALQISSWQILPIETWSCRLNVTSTSPAARQYSNVCCQCFFLASPMFRWPFSMQLNITCTLW
jgi:hypothetical protein